MNVKKCLGLPSVAALSLFFAAANAQVTGGQYAMEFLRMPQSPHITALGGINVSNPADDISLAMQNPSLLRPALHNQLFLGYNAYYADIAAMNLAYGYHSEKLNTTFAAGLQYFNYGNFVQTNTAGATTGSFKASEYNVALTAARQYGDRWRYGATLKWAQSNLYEYKGSAVLADVGITYVDTVNLVTIGATAKNMGVMVKKYNPNLPSEPLPFDLQIGITKRFAHLPLRVFTTIHHLYEWDIRYNNPADVEAGSILGTADTTSSSKGKFGDKLFRHFIFGGEILLGKRITATVSYNHLRRGELGLKERQAMAGFAFGGTLHLNKLNFYYARSYYHVAGAYNEFGLSMQLNKFVNVKAQNSNWNTTYDNWSM